MTHVPDDVDLDRAIAPDDDVSLEYARRWVTGHLGEGVVCPCCFQYAKRYRRKITSAMAYALMLIYRFTKTHLQCPHCASLLRLEDGGILRCTNEDRCGHVARLEWLHVPSFLAGQKHLAPRLLAAIRGDWAKLVHWGLLEVQPAVREDGSRRAGYYRLTPHGEDFVLGRIRVPMYVYIYAGSLKRLPAMAVETTGIRDALGKSFMYDELMSDGAT